MLISFMQEQAEDLMHEFDMICPIVGEERFDVLMQGWVRMCARLLRREKNRVKQASTISDKVSLKLRFGKSFSSADLCLNYLGRHNFE